MRILYLVHRVPYPPNKGDKIRALWEIQSLSRSHSIDLFCFYDHDEDRNAIDALKPYCRSFYIERLSWWGSRLRAAKAAAMGSCFSLAYFYSRSMKRRVSRAIATENYDAVIVFGSAMAPYAERFPTSARLLDMVDVDSDKWTAYAKAAPIWLRWLWRQEGRALGEYERRLAREFSATLLCTENEAGILADRVPGAPVRVLRHMVDTDYFDPSRIEIPEFIAHLQPYVIFAGSMDYQPNVEAADWFYRHVFPRLRTQVPGLNFVIAGRNPARKVRELGTHIGVHVTGSISDIRPYLRGASASVAPMLLARGVQNKVLESMAMGLPVSASSRTVAAFPPKIAELILVEDDPKVLADKLAAIVQQGPRPPVREIRDALVHFFGDSRLKQQLEDFLTESSRGCVVKRELKASGSSPRQIPGQETVELKQC